MQFPNGKQFAFTIIDDTDNDLIENTRPVYEFLAKMGLRTTKTVWSLPSRDSFKGLSLSDYRYRQYIKKLQRDGFEIALHSVSSGKMTRQDTLDGLEIFRQFIGEYPKIQANHGLNPDSIYWGVKRFSLLKPFWRFSSFKGDDAESIYFWGDYHKKNIKFTRNFTFHNLNTSKIDTLMPCKDPAKPFANYWFSSADGSEIEKFNKLTSVTSVDRLIKEKGAAIIYTHFASGFVKAGRLDRTFQRNMAYLARRNGYFVPAGKLLDHLLAQGKGQEMTLSEKLRLELKWLIDRIF